MSIGTNIFKIEMGGKVLENKIKWPELPKINWKLFIIIIVVLVIIVASIKFVFNVISEGNTEVAYKILSEDEVPEKVMEILPRYKMLERALATKIDEEIYVIVTRGEKLTEGYKVDITKIEFINTDDENMVIVYALFEDPDTEDLMQQEINYPYIIAKTQLTELPDKIELDISYKE